MMYAQLQHQLVLEIYVSSLDNSISFYQSLGFKLEWKVPDIFAQISWDTCILFLKAKSPAVGIDTQSTSFVSAGNLRIMVEDVDAKYKECQRLGYLVEQDIGDRKFVLRDFIIRDPDGFGVRFGSFLEGRGRKEQVEGADAEGVIRFIDRQQE